MIIASHSFLVPFRIIMSAAPPLNVSASSTVLVDGQCALCSAFARFVAANDTRDKFYLETQQSDEGTRLLAATNMPIDLSTIVLVECVDQQTNGERTRPAYRAHTKSTAVLRILRGLGGMWALLYVFVLVPAVVRDACYALVAKYRLVVFGKNDVCQLPTPVLRKRMARKRPPPHASLLESL